MEQLNGTLNGVGNIGGAVNAVGGLNGFLNINGGGASPPYEGAYEYTPTEETQIIEIVDKRATQNITINPIPQNYGLITWNGSTLTVS